MNSTIMILGCLCICLAIVHKSYAEVLELDESEAGTPVWKTGQYRDRDEIPLPPNYDEERKHRRDVSDTDDEQLSNNEVSKKRKKNLINRVHFSMPFGVDLPVYHISKVAGKKGKKSGVPQGYDKYTPNKLKLSESSEYAKLDIQRPDRKSSVSKSWGMTYDNLFPDNEKAQRGQQRSNLEGGYKITEDDLDSGMMFRGLGGLMLRDQNHQIIQSKFAEKEDSDEEMNARSDVTTRHM